MLCITEFTFPNLIRIVWWIQSWTSARYRYNFSFFVSSFNRMQKISLDSKFWFDFWRGDIVYRFKTQLSCRVETWVAESLSRPLVYFGTSEKFVKINSFCDTSFVIVQLLTSAAPSTTQRRLERQRCIFILSPKQILKTKNHRYRLNL